MSSQSAGAPAVSYTPVAVSAKGLHRLAVQAFRIGNRGRLSLCEALRALNETRYFYDLGFPSFAAYADQFFQLRRSEAFEYVRVGTALLELKTLRDAFGAGRIGWSVLKAVTRVADVDSQESWVGFAMNNGVERTLAEARDALRRGRRAPRDSSYGLPNLDQKLVLRFARSDMEKVRRWLEAGCAALAESTGSGDVTLEQAVLFLCERDAFGGAVSRAQGDRGDGAQAGGDRSSTSDARRAAGRAQIVYQQCPGCRRSRMATREGFVEVAPEEVERYEGSAETVVVDGPTPPRMRRKILAREAGRCGNPRCGNLADHCHHIVFRSRGGKTEPANEVAVCSTCHALVHAGLLRVTGNAEDRLRWLPTGCCDSPADGVSSRLDYAERFPVLQLVTQSADADSGRARGSISGAAAWQSADADSKSRIATSRDDLAQGLVRLGVPAARSRRLIDAAIAALPAAEISEAEVLRRAIRSI